jgi:hypothetical protein
MSDKFDWSESKQHFTTSATEALALERGVRPITIERWRQRGWIGEVYAKKRHKWCIAFPVGNNGQVWRAHYRAPERDSNGKWEWAYEPAQDPENRPVPALALGKPGSAPLVHFFESQWDALTATDRLEELFAEIDDGKLAIICTRGARFGNRIKELGLPKAVKAYAWAQNDQPGQDWLAEVLTALGQVHAVDIPKQHKDLGEWGRDGGATATDLETAIQGANSQKPPPPTDPDQQLFEDRLAKYRAALLTSAQLETAPIKPRAKFLGEWFWEGDLGFVYGPRGIGKTWFIDGLAVCLSIGRDFDSWVVPKAMPVLYIDGEMPEDLTRDRLKGLASGNNNLTVLHHEALFNSAGLSMNLAEPVTQRVITELCVEKKIKVLILDNLSCLVSGVKENDADAWEVLLPWILELRRRRIALVIVHHAGASGKRMRGTTKREDPAAWVIKLEATEGIDPSETGAKFEMAFTKLRTTSSPEWMRIWHFKTEADGQVSIGCQEVSFEGKVLQLIQDGLETATEIAGEMSCALSTISKVAKRLEAKKLIEIRNRRYYPRGFMNYQP